MTTRTAPQPELQPLYNVLKDAGVPIDHHESDLYAKVTPESRDIINAYYHRGDIRTVSTFKSQADGAMWYEVPFAYLPFWDKVKARAALKGE